MLKSNFKLMFILLSGKIHKNYSIVGCTLKYLLNTFNYIGRFVKIIYITLTYALNIIN